MMPNVNSCPSFAGRSPYFEKPRLNPKSQIGENTAGQLALATNYGFELASKELGCEVKPIRKITGTSLRKLNPKAFDKSGKLTEKGKEGFNAVNGQALGLTTSSKMHEYVSELKNQIVKTAYIEDDGTASVATYFDYYTK